MSYRIEWLPTPLQRFTAEFDALDLSREQDVIAALSDVDFQLMNLPLDSGESRDVITNRVLFQHPVVVFYKIRLRERVVEIIAAKTI